MSKSKFQDNEMTWDAIKYRKNPLTLDINGSSMGDTRDTLTL